ncbi:MAG: hypothetical protein NVS1B1_01910 [Candidatus Limnocylindrales bacterium]
MGKGDEALPGQLRDRAGRPAVLADDRHKGTGIAFIRHRRTLRSATGADQFPDRCGTASEVAIR